MLWAPCPDRGCQAGRTLGSKVGGRRGAGPGGAHSRGFIGRVGHPWQQAWGQGDFGPGLTVAPGGVNRCGGRVGQARGGAMGEARTDPPCPSQLDATSLEFASDGACNCPSLGRRREKPPAIAHPGADAERSCCDCPPLPPGQMQREAAAIAPSINAPLGRCRETPPATAPGALPHSPPPGAARGAPPWCRAGGSGDPGGRTCPCPRPRQLLPVPRGACREP